MKEMLELWCNIDGEQSSAALWTTIEFLNAKLNILLHLHRIEFFELIPSMFSVAGFNNFFLSIFPFWTVFRARRRREHTEHWMAKKEKYTTNESKKRSSRPN